MTSDLLVHLARLAGRSEGDFWSREFVRAVRAGRRPDPRAEQFIAEALAAVLDGTVEPRKLAERLGLNQAGRRKQRSRTRRQNRKICYRVIELQQSGERLEDAFVIAGNEYNRSAETVRVDCYNAFHTEVLAEQDAANRIMPSARRTQAFVDGLQRSARRTQAFAAMLRKRPPE